MRKYYPFRHEKPGNNPAITRDSFLVDDAVFVQKDNKNGLCHKGCPKTVDEKGRADGVSHNIFLRVATVDKPGGSPYRKAPAIFHRGHEALVWRD